MGRLWCQLCGGEWIDKMKDGAGFRRRLTDGSSTELHKCVVRLWGSIRHAFVSLTGLFLSEHGTSRARQRVSRVWHAERNKPTRPPSSMRRQKHIVVQLQVRVKDCSLRHHGAARRARPHMCSCFIARRGLSLKVSSSSPADRTPLRTHESFNIYCDGLHEKLLIAAVCQYSAARKTDASFFKHISVSLSEFLCTGKRFGTTWFTPIRC